MPQKARVTTKETSRINRLSCYWKRDADKVSVDATHANKAAVRFIKQSEAALQRKGGTCLCGVHYKCHHSECLPMKKRKLCGDFEDASTFISARSDSDDDESESSDEEGIESSESDMKKQQSFEGPDDAELMGANHSPRAVPEMQEYC